MTTLWERVANSWRTKKEFVDRDLIGSKIERNLQEVKTTIKNSNQVPSAWDAIFGDDDDDDDDW